MTLLLAACALGAPGVEIPLADPGWDELVAGSRVAFLVSRGQGADRETLIEVPGCVEVLGVTAAGVRVALDAAQLATLHRSEADARVRAALCASSATAMAKSLPAGRYAMPPASSVPAGLLRLLVTGDHVDVLASIPAGRVPEATTVTMLRGIEVVGACTLGNHVGLSLTGAEAERYAHALDSATVHVTVLPGPREDPATSVRMSSIVPAGLVIAAAPVPARSGLHGFQGGGDYVDVVVVVDDRPILALQAVFTLTPGDGALDLTPPIVALTTPDQAEQWMHAATFVRTGYALRNPEDVAFVDLSAAVAPGVQPPLDAIPASGRVALGARGVSVPYDSAAPPVVGRVVPLVREGCPPHALVLAVAPRPNAVQQQIRGLVGMEAGQGRALVQVSPAEALAMVRAPEECRVAP